MVCGSPSQIESQNMKININSLCPDKCISHKMFNETEVKIDFNTGKLTIIEESKAIYKVIFGLINILCMYEQSLKTDTYLLCTS